MSISYMIMIMDDFCIETITSDRLTIIITRLQLFFIQLESEDYRVFYLNTYSRTARRIICTVSG